MGFVYVSISVILEKMITPVNNNLNNSKKVSFTSVPIFKLKVPKLNKYSYELAPVLFSKLDSSDPLDKEMVEGCKRRFGLTLSFSTLEQSKKDKSSKLSIPALFLHSCEELKKEYDFFALELPNVTETGKKILGLMVTRKEKNSEFYGNNTTFVEMLNVRRGLKKNEFLNFTKRKYKSTGELMMYGIGKLSKKEDCTVALLSGCHAFYDKIGLSGRTFRKFSPQELDDFLVKTEKKFNL